MRYLASVIGFSAPLVLATLSALPVFSAEYEPVTDERLVNPEPENWLMYRGTYDSHGYSPLTEINSRNVKRLKPLWTFSTGLREESVNLAPEPDALSGSSPVL